MKEKGTGESGTLTGSRPRESPQPQKLRGRGVAGGGGGKKWVRRERACRNSLPGDGRGLGATDENRGLGAAPAGPAGHDKDSRLHFQGLRDIAGGC